jgi:alpha-L-arabinofuranosidase
VPAEVSIGTDWTTLTGCLEVDAHAKADGLFLFALNASADANVVLARVLLYPDDHVNCADPDVIRLLKESRLPLLRWPGGNFVSGYRWRDGVGPIDARPTLPNPAWEGLEYNFFGTDEFIAFCRAVGCEPLICVNAGDGDEHEAAAWVEYCNGAAESPMGRLRAANGHPKPYGVQRWEVGNEIWGRFQVNWTTPGGNAARYLRFRETMLRADPTIQLMACGDCGNVDGEWNERLIRDAGPKLRSVTHHLLSWAAVGKDTDPAELFNSYMGQAVDLGRQYRGLRQRMTQAGITAPRLAVTECQLFAHFQGEAGDTLSGEKTPRPPTISEALYFATLAHECIRLGDFVELFTHSATVNHGGGLHKGRERVWADPVHHAHAMSAALFGATPVAVALQCAAYSTRATFGFIPPLTNVPALDVLAALSPDRAALVLMLVHRCATVGPINLVVNLANFRAAPEAEVVTLAADTPYALNSLSQPELIRPCRSLVLVERGRTLSLMLPRYSLTRVILQKQ